MNAEKPYKTPARLPDGPIPDEDREFLEHVQTALFGKTSEVAVRARTCLECNATNIMDKDFSSPENMRWYFIFGMCQECQDKLAAWAKIRTVVAILRQLGL